MTQAQNPTGRVLSGPRVRTPDGEYIVVFRPNIGGRRRRVAVDADVADILEAAQEDEIAHRHGLVGKKRKASKRKASKRKASKRKASKRKASKASTRKATERAPTAAPSGPAQQELFSNPTRGAPKLAALGAVAQLGQVVKLIVEAPDGQHLQHHWKRNHPLLLWSPKQKCLLWVVGRALKGRRKGAVRADGAANLFERWSQRDAKHTASISVPNRKLSILGAAVQIVYRSDKWGARETYEHEFSARVRVFQGGPVWAVRGGPLTVTERGIVY